MKYLKGFISLALLSVASNSVQAEDFWQATGKYMQKYGVPCISSIAAGYVIDHDKGVQIGSIACVAVFTYGEFGRSSNRSITSDDVEIIQGMINQESNKSSMRIKEDFDAKIDRLNQRFLEESNSNRQNLRNAVTDLGVYLEKDLNDKIDKRMENPKLLQDIDGKINLKVKEEVQDEFRSKEREIVDKTSERVIKRVTAEPIIIDDKPKPSPSPAQ